MSTTRYEPVIGLEVHAQLLTRTKMFCGCPIAYGAPPNTQVCPVCLGMPGALPVPNGAAIALAIRAALALGCTVRHDSVFARKNYFYPDLSKGYQISQFELPLNERGTLRIDGDGGPRDVGITRIHVEEDAAKNLHGASEGTLVDFNRAGTALIEIVGEPDLRSAAEAESYLRKLRDILIFIGVNDGNLEEGSFRCDANVSLRPVGAEQFGTRTELKNINSFRFVRKGIEHEIIRQEAVLSAGGKIVQETRTYSATEDKTISLRSKEEAHDYRYFPDPDLPVLHIDQALIDAVAKAMPELPAAKRARWEKELGLTAYDAQVLTGHPGLAAYFEEVVRAAGKAVPPKRAANFVQSEVLRVSREHGLVFEVPVTAAQLAELLEMIESNAISGKIAKDVFADMVETGQSPKKIVEKKGLSQVSDAGAIEEVARGVLAANAAQVTSYKGGKTNVLGFLVGQVMKATKGTASPGVVNDVLKKLLDA